MNIVINCVDGSVIEHAGMPNHLSLRENLERMGYVVHEEVRPPSWADRAALCCRDEKDEYDEGEFDVAEEA